MRQGFIFNTARAAAFASLVIWAGVLPVQIATAAPLPSGHDIGDSSPGVLIHVFKSLIEQVEAVAGPFAHSPAGELR